MECAAAAAVCMEDKSIQYITASIHLAIGLHKSKHIKNLLPLRIVPSMHTCMNCKEELVFP